MVLRSMVPSVPNESFSSKIIDSLLAAKETGEELHLEFVKNRVPYHNTSFFETIIKWYNLQRGEKEDTKGNFSADGGSSSSRIVFSKFTDKKDEFHYPLTSYPLAIADPSGKLYQPTAKHLFRNELITLSCDSIEKIHLIMQFIFMMEWQ